MRRLRRRAVFLVLAAMLLTGCGGALVGDRTRSLTWHPRYHTVEEGDTLYSVAWTYGYDYKTVAEWNDIPPPYVIHVGDRVRVAPPADFEGARRAASGGARSGSPATASRAPAPAADPIPDAPPVDWTWPASGEVIRSYDASRAGKKGIDIAGSEGDPVVAAAGGRVVYSGSGLIGYGKLIIIKHDHNFLSAYAHNNDLLVREGEAIDQGERIAEMGSTGTDRVLLHFQIRRDGRPVNPLGYLPQR